MTPATVAGPAGALRPDAARGWLVVASAFVALLVSFGVAYNFGSLVGPMSQSLHLDASAAGWVFSLSSFTFLSLGTVTGPLADRYGPRPLLVAGGLFLAGGLALTSIAGQLAVVVAGYIGVGIGVGCVYVPSVANVGAWFVRHRVQAIGVAVTGIGVGTILSPIITAALVDAVGWRRTNLYLGVAAMILVLICVPAMPAAVRPTRAEATWSLARLAQDKTFRLLYVSGIAMGLITYVPFVFLVPMAQQSGIAPVRAAALVSAIGLSSTMSRVLFGLAAGRLGVVVAYKLTMFATWLSFLLWLPSRSYWALLAFAVVFGAGYGGIIALSPALLGKYFGVGSLGTAAGIFYTSASIGSLFGPPLAGLLIGTANRYGLLSVVVFVVATLGVVGPLLLPREHPAAESATVPA